MAKKKDNEKQQALTKSEMQVMTILWNLDKPSDVKAVIDQYAEPKPAYTTVSTFLTILQNKRFVDFEKGTGKTHLYYPIISRENYTKQVMRDVKDNFFGGNASSLLSFFVKEEKLSKEELEAIMKLIEK